MGSSLYIVVIFLDVLPEPAAPYVVSIPIYGARGWFSSPRKELLGTWAKYSTRKHRV